MSKRSRANITVGNYPQLMLALQAAGGGVLERGYQNSVTSVDQTIGNPGAAPAAYVHQAILLTAQVTGKFMVGWSYPFNSNTTGDTVTNVCKASGWKQSNWTPISGTGNIAITNGTKVATALTGALVGSAINGGSAPGIYQATAAGTSITVTTTGANADTPTMYSVTQPCLTGLLTANGMQWQSGSGIFYDFTQTTPFAIGAPVCFFFTITATDTVSMTGGATFWAYELPF